MGQHREGHRGLHVHALQVGEADQRGGITPPQLDRHTGQEGDGEDRALVFIVGVQKAEGCCVCLSPLRFSIGGFAIGKISKTTTDCITIKGRDW